MPKRYTKKLHNRVAKATNDIFNEAICEVIGVTMFNSDGKINNEFMDAVSLMRSAKAYVPGFADEETKAVLEQKSVIDAVYLDKLITLPTRSLEEILFSHDRGQITRAPRTIEMITSELARRMIMGDSLESDTKK